VVEPAASVGHDDGDETPGQRHAVVAALGVRLAAAAARLSPVYRVVEHLAGES
jgi:hypothetical protein